MVKRKRAGEIQVFMCKTQDTENEGSLIHCYVFQLPLCCVPFKCHVYTCLFVAHLSVAEVRASAGCLYNLSAKLSKTKNNISSILSQAAFSKQSYIELLAKKKKKIEEKKAKNEKKKKKEKKGRAGLLAY